MWATRNAAKRETQLTGLALGEVLVARPHSDRLTLLEVAYLHDTALDHRQRAVAAVLHVPLRSDHCRCAALALRLDATLPLSPKPALLDLLLGDARLAAALAAGELVAQRERGQRLLVLLLVELEEPLVEPHLRL